MKIESLPGLGPKSAQQLAQIGIHTAEELKQRGAIATYVQLIQAKVARPNLNYLYALEGAIQGTNWLQVARRDKARLLQELEGYQLLQSFDH